MRFTSPRSQILAVALGLLLALVCLHPRTALAQNDEQRFADLLAQRDGVTSLAGPLSGELAQEVGFSTVNGAGVFADSFSAMATFENPVTPGSAPWDFGFVFHLAEDGAQQVVIDSDGLWYYSPFPDGTLASGFAPTIDTDPGATNTVDLVVAGDGAVLGINGEFVTRIELPSAVASDVQVGTGFFTNTTEAGRTVGYLDFEVWPLAGNAEALLAEFETPASNVAQTDVTPEAEASPTTETGPGSDQEAFSFLLDVQEQVVPVAGPFSANLKEAADQVTQSWAGVNLDAFHARATFDVPQAASETPWDFGLTFGASPNGPLHIAIDSLGNWYYSIGSGGPTERGTVSGLIADEGGSNTIDLLVAEQRAVFGVNGAFVSQIELPPDSTSGDVAVGSAFYSDQTLPDRIIPFTDFEVLPFDPSALPNGEVGGSPSAADSEAFAGYLGGTQSSAPAAGPFAGRLVEATSGTVPQAAAGISLADFGAVVTFTNPNDAGNGTWDAGFQFRAQGDATHRIVLRSIGEVYAVLADGTTTVVGTATDYDATPGATNDVQLFVDGDRALIGVNGELAAVVELPEAPLASDILVGSSFFGEDFAEGRVTGYEGFSIWELA